MKNFKSIQRLNEDHEAVLNPEILSMTVGEMLDTLEAHDTKDSAEYEIIEDAIVALSNKIIGYSNDKDFDINSVESEKESMPVEGEDDLPGFSDIDFDKQVRTDSSDSSDLENFTF